MKEPRTTSAFSSHRLFLLTFFVMLLALLLAPKNRIETSAQGWGEEQTTAHSYASLDAGNVAALDNLYKELQSGEPFSEEEKYVLRRFAAGGQISELEGRIVIARVLYKHYVTNEYLSEGDLDLLKKYSAYCLTEHHFIEDQRLQMKREAHARQLAMTPTAKDVQPNAIPVNDTCDNAIAITDTGSYPITTATVDALDATTTGDPSFCAAVSGQDDTIWYTFVPSITATYTITTCPASAPGTGTTDTILGIFTSSGGCGGALTSVDCNDDDLTCNNNASTITPILTGGVTYYIVAGRSTFLAEPPTVPIQIAISRLPAPANDTCATATPLSLNTPISGGTTVAANDDYRLSGTSCFSGWGDNSVGNSTTTAPGRDVVYSFTAPAAGTYSFRVTGFGVTLDPVLYLMTSCPGGTAPVTVTCSNTTGPATVAAHRVNGTGAQEIPCVSLTGGQTVYLVVDEALLTSGSTSFTVEVNTCTQEIEGNDSPATAGVGTEGVLSSNTDVDFYVLGTPAADSRVFALVDGVAANDTDFQMRVTTTTDTLEFDNNDADSPFGSLSPAIGGTLLPGAESFLRINRGASGSNAIGPYRLYAKVQPGGSSNTPNCAGTKNSATAESEPNNSIAQANSAANNYFYGTIPTPAPATDVDYYSFSATAGDLIFMALDGDPCRGGSPAAMNAALELQDSSGSVLISVNDSDGVTCTTCTAVTGTLTATQPVGTAEALVFRARYTGTYYAKVFTGTNTTVGTGEYLLSISLNNDHGPTAADSSISGQVVGTTGGPLAGVTMVLTSGSAIKRTTTDADGHYSFPELETGDFFVVAPESSSQSFSPTKRPYSLRSNVLNADFTGNPVWAESTVTRDSAPTAQTNNLKKPQDQATGGQSMEQSWATATPPLVPRVSPRLGSEALTVQQGIVAGPAVKIQIQSTGWYRVGMAELLAAGLDPAVNTRMLQLFVDGEEVPIRVNGDGVHLGANDTLEFYGVALDTPTTDTRTYWLISGNSAGKRITAKRSKIIDDQLWTSSAGAAGFSYTTEFKEKLTYFPSVLNGDEENIFGSLIMKDPATQNLVVRHLDSEATTPAELEIALQGATLLDHKVQVRINGTFLGTITFKDREHPVTKMALDSGLLCEGDNIVSLAATGGDSDISFVDWMRLAYSHRYVADDNKLQFSVQSGQSVRVSGFTTPNVRLIDVTNPDAVSELQANASVLEGGYAVRIQPKGGGTRILVAFADESAKQPRSVLPNQPSTLNAATNGADLVVIVHKDFRAAIEPLAAQRRNEGLTVSVVDVEDVYDEFSYGAHTPFALKEFLSWTTTHWSHAPEYVLLVGDSSWDPRNYLGQGENDFVPTKLIDTSYMETASDDWLVDFAGTGLPTIAVGRIPGRNTADISLVVSKILAYELERQSGAPARGAVMVADRGFEKESGQTQQLLPADLNVQSINRGDLATDDINRGEIVNALNLGPTLVNYFGHGSVAEWSGEGLNNDLASSLNNTVGRSSLYVLMTCLNGYFHDAYIDSLGEAVLKAPNGGGMAVWASTGLTEPTPQFSMSSEFYRQLFGTQTLRLGQVTSKAKGATADPDVRRTWVLLGDPTMRLR